MPPTEHCPPFGCLHTCMPTLLIGLYAGAEVRSTSASKADDLEVGTLDDGHPPRE